MEMLYQYSLCGVVKDQCIMLSREGNDVHLFVNEEASIFPEPWMENITIHKKIPFFHMTDYQSRGNIKPEDKEVIEKMKGLILNDLQEYDYVFTHDFIFTGWNMPYALGMIQATRIKPGGNPAESEVRMMNPKQRWFNWVHSVPTGLKDWWNISEYGRKHKIIYPNSTDRLAVAEQFRGRIDNVRIIPHILDPRTWFDFDQNTWDFIDEFPKVLSSSIVCICPVPADRMRSKGLGIVMEILFHMMEQGHEVFLIVPNQWANGREADIKEWIKIAAGFGFKYGDNFTFTSTWKMNEKKGHGKYALGLPKKILRNLIQLCNLYICPTQEESFGFVPVEIALTGGVYMVLNSSLEMQREIIGFNGLYFQFGSHRNKINIADDYYKQLAMIIAGRMSENELVGTKSFVRQAYNWNRIYQKYYVPLLGESKVW